MRRRRRNEVHDANWGRGFAMVVRLLVVVVAALAVGAASATPSFAVPPCWPDCEEPPPPSRPPVVALDTARQTTDGGSVHVAGWAADPDAPLTPLTVKISIDGAAASTVTADGSRPDVGTRHPQYGEKHGYDVVVPAAATAQQACVVAVNVGSGYNRTVCRQIATVSEFEADGINYDIANATLAATNLVQLEFVSNENATAVEQSTTISGQRVLTDTRGWSDTSRLKVSIQVKVKVPIFGGTEVTLTGEAEHSYTQNSTTSESRTFSWSQPVRVPARSRVDATVAITRSTIVVPYTMSGSYVYGDGLRVPGSINGTYSGVNSHHLKVTLVQYNLDGSPAAQPVEQPAAALSVS
jgi:hypothetical protein